MTIDIESMIAAHASWLRGEPGGQRANLSRANLSRANLSKANLSGANLSKADLSEADLSGANLSRADLSRADLSWANLSGANLRRADLSRANLRWAGLSRIHWPEPTIVLGPRGLRGDNLVYRIRSDAVHAGCWSGTLEEFSRRVDDEYLEGTRYGDAYRRDITYLKGERAAEEETTT